MDTSEGFRFEPPRVLLEGRYGLTEPAHGYDVAPDGETFLMAKFGPVRPPITTIELVLDWQTELERRLPPP